MFIIISGCTDEEKILTDPTPTPTVTPTLIPSITGASQTNTTPIVIITDTPAPTIRTPTPMPTPEPIRFAEGGEIRWCNIRHECEIGVRKPNSEMCIAVHEMLNITMDYYCGIAPIQTSAENRPPRTFENGTLDLTIYPNSTA